MNQATLTQRGSRSEPSTRLALFPIVQPLAMVCGRGVLSPSEASIEVARGLEFSVEFDMVGISMEARMSTLEWQGSEAVRSRRGPKRSGSGGGALPPRRAGLHQVMVVTDEESPIVTSKC